MVILLLEKLLNKKTKKDFYMLNNEFINQLNRSPVIFSMKDEQNFKRAVLSDYKILFFLFGGYMVI